MDWISETFSAAPKEGDVVTARSLNVTRMSAVVAPILAGIWTAISEWTDRPPFDDTDFQRQLILAFVGLVAVVSVADILGRAIARSKSAPAAVLFPKPWTATQDVAGERDLQGQIVAFRVTDAEQPSLGEFLFVGSDGKPIWVPSSKIFPEPSE